MVVGYIKNNNIISHRESINWLSMVIYNGKYLDARFIPGEKIFKCKDLL